LFDDRPQLLPRSGRWAVAIPWLLCTRQIARSQCCLLGPYRWSPIPNSRRSVRALDPFGSRPPPCTPCERAPRGRTARHREAVVRPEAETSSASRARFLACPQPSFRWTNSKAVDLMAVFLLVPTNSQSWW
jgi:hypothetical protein